MAPKWNLGARLSLLILSLIWHHCNPHIDVYLKDIHELIYFLTHTLHSNHFFQKKLLDFCEMG